MTNDHPHPRTTTGTVLHAARFYDFLAWALMRGRETIFREKLLDLARVRAGERILDVGCGTGTLAMVAKRRVGPSGAVYGVDPSPEMIARAKKKAAQAELAVAFANEIIESLPFPDAEFDAAFLTLMIHHLPQPVREKGIREIARTLKPAGRLLIAEIGQKQRQGFLAHLHRRDQQVSPSDLAALLKTAGLQVMDQGPVGFLNMHYTLAARGAHPQPRNASPL